MTPVPFVVWSGDREEEKRERSRGLVPVCWERGTGPGASSH